MPKVDNAKTAAKLKRTVRSPEKLKKKIEVRLKYIDKINVPKEFQDNKTFRRVETLKSFLTCEDYVNAQLETEDGKDNIIMLTKSLETAGVKLKKIITTGKIDDYEDELE